nr:MAG TPA: hypothetical protein [Caudoviricetes sp.]
MDMNVNSTECLKTVNFIGYQEVHNICTGAVATVNWGTADYLIVFGIGGFVTAILLMMLVLVGSIAKDVFFG